MLKQLYQIAQFSIETTPMDSKNSAQITTGRGAFAFSRIP